MKYRRADKAAKIIMIGLTVIYCIFFLIMLCIADDSWELFIVGALAILTAPSLIALLAIVGFVRYVLHRGNGGANDKPLAAFTNITALITAVFTLLIGIAHFITSMVPISPPYDGIYLSSHLTKMGLAFGGLTLVPIALGFLFQRMIGKESQNKKYKAARLRATVILLIVVIDLSVLLIPRPMGTYNDGGSRIYEAVLYEAIDWNRAQDFDGTPVYAPNQRLRVYFFPANCFDYDAKWELRH